MKFYFLIKYYKKKLQAKTSSEKLQEINKMSGEQCYSENIGEICERGYLESMMRKGITPELAFSEMVGNTMDAFDAYDKKYPNNHINKQFRCENGQKETRMFDNAIGMTVDETVRMLKLQHENHAHDTSRGVSGVGAKIAMINLSNKTPVKICTRQPGATRGHTITIPWDKIYTDYKYTGMMKGLMKNMTEEEERIFYEERKRNGMLNEKGEAHGTTFEFIKSNSILRDVIIRNMKSIKTLNDENNEKKVKKVKKVKNEKKENKSKLTINPLNRIGCVFGRDKVKITCKDYELGEFNMNMYDYFGGNPEEYYLGISTYPIEHWYSKEQNEDRFIYRDGDTVLEITKSGNGYHKKPEESTINMQGYIKVGINPLKVGLRCDKNIFDYDNPKLITAENITCEYNDIHVGDDKKFLGSTRLVRNGQIIGYIRSEVKISSARGGGQTYFSTLVVQSELLSNPLSTQGNNPQDRIFGVQEIKGYINPSSHPLNLSRLVEHLRLCKSNEIWEMFQKKVNERQEVEDEVEDEEVEEEVEEVEDEVEDEVEEVKVPEVPEVEVVEVKVVSEPVVEVVEVKVVSEPVVEVVEVKVVSETVVEEEKVEESKKTIKPHEVGPFRRGGVTGKELIQEMERFIKMIDPESIYIDRCIEIYNLVQTTKSVKTVSS